MIKYLYFIMSNVSEKLTAKIFLKKTKFFGLHKKYAILIVIPSLKIVKIKTNIKNLPFYEKNILDLQALLIFVKNYNFNITYYTNNKILKRLLNEII